MAVLYGAPQPATLDSPALTLEGGLERLLRRSVQVVVLNSAPVDLVHRVFRDGRLVFEGDRSARIAFEVKARNEYFDLLPILRRYRRLERAVVTDPELVAKKLAQIETCVRELRAERDGWGRFTGLGVGGSAPRWPSKFCRGGGPDPVRDVL